MSIDFGMKQTLIDAGLVDPTSGEFTSEPNFGAPPESPDPRAPEPPLPDDVPEERPQEKPAEQPQEQPTQEPASQPQVRPSEPHSAGQAGSPDGDPNRLGAASDPIRVEYDQTVAQLQQQAQAAFLYGRSLTDEQGQRLYNDEQLAQLIGPQLQNAQQQAYLAGVMKRMEPVARRAAAEKIAAEHGVPVEEIVNEASPVEMQTKAKTIATLERDGRYVRRKESGADTVEGSRNFNNAIPAGIENLSPQQKMYVGLARGDR